MHRLTLVGPGMHHCDYCDDGHDKREIARAKAVRLAWWYRREARRKA